MDEVQKLAALLKEYGQAKAAHAAAKAKQKAEIADLEKQIRETKAKHNLAISQAKTLEAMTRSALELEARGVKETTTTFQGNARLQLPGGYVEVQAQKEKAEIADIVLFLTKNAPEVLVAIINSISLDQSTLFKIHEKSLIHGLKITQLPRVVKASYKEENDAT